MYLSCAEDARPSTPSPPQEALGYSLGIELCRAAFDAGTGVQRTGHGLFHKRTSTSAIWVSLVWEWGNGAAPSVLPGPVSSQPFQEEQRFPLNGWDRLPASFVSQCESTALMQTSESPKGMERDAQPNEKQAGSLKCPFLTGAEKQESRISAYKSKLLQHDSRIRKLCSIGRPQGESRKDFLLLR